MSVAPRTLRTDRFVDFIVNVPTSHSYTMKVRYANGGTATSTQGRAYDGGAFRTLSYPVDRGVGSVLYGEYHGRTHGRIQRDQARRGPGVGRSA